MGTGTTAAPVAAPAVGTGPMFKWEVTPAPAAPDPTPWAKDKVVVIRQVNEIAPTEPDLKPYLMVYEADRAWEEKNLSKDKELREVLAIQGQFDDTGKFSVTKVVAFNESESKHGLTIEIKMKDKAGGDVALKDKTGAALAKLLVTLPSPDTDDDTWELDLALVSSKTKERRQDRLVVQVPEVKTLLKDPAKYKDERYKPAGSKTVQFPKWIETRRGFGRKDYSFWYVHCMVAAFSPFAEWLDDKACFKTLDDIGFGAHYVIGRDGTINHCVPCHLVSQHVGDPEGKIGGKTVGGNTRSTSVEMVGFLDDIGIGLMLCRALHKLATSPPAGMSGSLSAAKVAQLKAAASFLCFKQNDRTSESNEAKRTTERCEKMIEGFKGLCKDTDVDPLTSIWVPDDRDKWSGGGLAYYGDARAVANRGLQLFYLHAKLGSAASLELQAPSAGSLAIEGSNVKCVAAAGTDLDTAEGITLFRMKKDDTLPGREAGGKRFATVMKAKLVEFNTALLTAALQSATLRAGNQEKLEVITSMSDADFDKMMGYTDAQYKALADLTQAMHRIYRFGHIVTHHFASKPVKRDPGGYFNWDKFLGDANLDELRTVPEFNWVKTDDARQPKEFAERIHKGCWPA